MGVDFDFQATNGSNQALDLSSAKELTFGNGAAVHVSFQVITWLSKSECGSVTDFASLGMSPTSFSSTGKQIFLRKLGTCYLFPLCSLKGRLVIQPTSSNQCLTITNPSSSSGPYYVLNSAPAIPYHLLPRPGVTDLTVKLSYFM